MNHEDIINEWKQDNSVDPNNIQKEIVKTPLIHSKYLDYYLKAKTKLISAERKFGEMRGVKRRYYTGKMTREELAEYGWEQWQGLKLSNSELMMVCEEDSDMTILTQKVEYYKALVQGLDFIMKAINARTYEIKNLVEHQKYLSGV